MTVESRIEVGFDIGEYQADYLNDDYEKRVGTLHYESTRMSSTSTSSCRRRSKSVRATAFSVLA